MIVRRLWTASVGTIAENEMTLLMQPQVYRPGLSWCAQNDLHSPNFLEKKHAQLRRPLETSLG